MKAILLSIKPKWIAKILNGDKTIEIRKTIPKCDLPIDVYIYCTKDNRKLLYSKILDNYALEVKHDDVQNSLTDYELNGKVVAKFTVRKVEEITATEDRYGEETWYETYSLACDELLEKSCLDFNELDEYMYGENGNAQGYAYHIEDLVIFEKPKELSEFTPICKEREKNGCGYCNICGWNKNDCLKFPNCQKRLTKAPQNFCYVESEE